MIQYTHYIASSSLSTAYSQADFFGKLIFIGLFLLSILSWVVLIHKTWQAKWVKRSSVDFEKKLEKNKDRLLQVTLEEIGINMHSRSFHSPYIRIFQQFRSRTVDVLNKNHFFLGNEEKRSVYLSQNDIELVETTLLSTVSHESKQLEKNLFILSTIVTLAPFLGLLGTVWGILMTFSELQKGGFVGSNQAILGGLSTALATTVLGLVIAIPALIFYNYLKNSLKYLTSDMENFLYRLLGLLELQYRKPGG